MVKRELKSFGLDFEKTNYNVLKPESQSSTITTIANDYIHYSHPKALIVREMSRLQSIYDSITFQVEYVSL